MNLALRTTRDRLLATAFCVSLLATATPIDAAPRLRNAASNTASGLQSSIANFRADLGGNDNGAGGSTTTGRREINWDAVPAGASAPNGLPADFFNITSPRGVVFSTPGTGFQVSGAPPRFGNVNAVYPSQFRAFSAEKLFRAVGSTITEVTFRVPGTNVPATVSGFGVVFVDVDVFDSTLVEYFDERGVSIGPPPEQRRAIAIGDGFSFVGVSFDAGERIARVRITSGSSALDASGVDNDAVVMDDFIYGEPQAIIRPTALDPTFSVDGQAYESLGFSENGSGLVRQPDGKIVVVGSAVGRGGSGESDVLVARYTVDGRRDPAFNNESLLAFSWGADLTGADVAHAVALQPDGKIVIAGFTSVGGFGDFAIARLLPDGTFDAAFDGDGKRVVDFTSADAAFAVDVQPDGRIVVAGSSGNDIAVLRLLPDGALDPSFNSMQNGAVGNGNGLLRIDLGGTERASDMALAADGSIILVGQGGGDTLVAKVTSAGALARHALVPFVGADSAAALVVLPDGRLVLGGNSGNGTLMYVARLSSDFVPDPTFNGTGHTTVDFGVVGGPLTADQLGGLAVQPDGKIVLAGHTFASGGAAPVSIALARLTAAGLPDDTFAPDGRQIVDLGGDQIITDLVLQPDGRLVVTGRGLTDDMLTARFIGGPPPAVTITTPTTNPSIASTSAFANLLGTAADPAGIVQVRWSTSRGFSGAATGTTNWAADVPLLGGNNFVTITASNANGVVSSDTINVAVNEFVYFLSEGATGPFFDLDILLANPTATPADVAISYLKPDGTTVPQTFTLGANTRRTVRVDDIAGLTDTAVSAVIRSTNGIPLVVERSMFWDATYYGGHTGNAVEAPRTQWLFAEGSQGFFDTYVLLANANATDTQATVTFLVEGAPNVSRTFNVAASSRFNVYTGLIPELVGRSFSIVVTATQPIIAERAMYFGARMFEGGHESAGVPEAATSWFHAEGATGNFFDTYILLGNPNAGPASVTMTFLTDGGLSIVRNKVIPANSRLTVFVDGEAAALAATAVSTTVTSNVPIISERAMYWAGSFNTWFEAHNSFGMTSTGTKWALAEGRVGGNVDFNTFVLVANPAPVAATVRATFLRTNGATVVKSYTVQPTRRFNIWVNNDVPELANEEFGVIIEVLNGVNVAVERAMYWRSGGVDFAGGTNATAVRVP